MNPEPVYEADRVRIQNHAKIRTAEEHPNFIQEQYRLWQEKTGHRFYQQTRQEYAEYLANYYSSQAWLAQGRELAMGRKLDKLQKRIGRQRKANREQHEEIKRLRQQIKELSAGATNV